MLNSIHEQMDNEYTPDQFNWKVRKVFNWLGSTEFMIELIGIEGCVGYGNTVQEARADLIDALDLWIRSFGVERLPGLEQEAQLIFIAPPMDEQEFSYINSEIVKLKKANLEMEHSF